jgi:hypothetical protein
MACFALGELQHKIKRAGATSEVQTTESTYSGENILVPKTWGNQSAKVRNVIERETGLQG